MPIFEYQCQVCKKKFEEFFRSSDEIHTKKLQCPLCSSPDIRRIFTTPNSINLSPWKEQKNLMVKDALGEIELDEKDYPYDYKSVKGRL